MKEPEKSWSERHHYIRDDVDEPRHYGNDPLRMENEPNQQDINPEDTRPGEMFAYVVILAVAVVCGVGLYWVG